jgi:hypothetical protein
VRSVPGWETYSSLEVVAPVLPLATEMSREVACRSVGLIFCFLFVCFSYPILLN